MSQPSRPRGRTSLFERITAALGFVALAAAAGMAGYFQPPHVDPAHEDEGAIDPRTPVWRRTVVGTWRKFNRNQIPQAAGGVAFFALLSVFPGIAAFVSLYGLFADADQAARHLAILAGVLPRAALSMAAGEMTRLASSHRPALGFAFALSLIFSLWSANGAVKSLFNGLNTAYEARERRGLLHLNLVSLTFTVATLLFMMLAFGLIVSGPMALQAVGLGGHLAPGSFGLLRWPLLFVGSMSTEALLYRFGPCRPRPPWRFVAPGCVFATALWLAVSMGFTWYVAHFGHYERTYGSLGAVIAFMIWLWLSAIAVLAGAELNAELEIQARPIPSRLRAGRGGRPGRR